MITDKLEQILIYLLFLYQSINYQIIEIYLYNISEISLTKEEECSNIKTTNQGGTNQCTRKDFLYRKENIGKEMVQNET